MSYVHCHVCGWSQDDFYDKDGYNPLRVNWMGHYADSLLEDRIDITETMREYFEYVKDESAYFGKGSPWSNFNPNICDKEGDTWFMNGRDYVVWNLRNLADRFEQQRWMTREEWLNSEDQSCPNCGEEHLCED